MISVASIIASYVFNALWQVPLLALTGSLICRLLRRLGPSIEHGVWVTVLFASVVLPASRIIRLSSLPRGTSPTHFVASVRLLALQPIVLRPTAFLVLPSVVIAATAIFYVAVCFFFLAGFLASIRSAARLVKRSSPVHLESAYLELWHGVRNAIQVSDIRILSSSDITGPVTLWSRRPILLLPEHFAESTSILDFHVALAHEGSHIRRHDYLKNLFYEGISLFAAFHPATWMIKARIAQTREMTCDAMAVAAVGESRVYVQSLLRLAGAIASCPRVETYHAIGFFDANILEKRIMTIRAKKVTTSAASRYALILVGGLCLSLAVTGGAAAAVGVSSASPASLGSPNNDDQIYEVGKDVSPPKLISAPDPEYPKSARARGKYNGTCIIGLVVDTKGTPRKVHVVRSLSKDFDANAIKSVEQYRFSPAEHLGKPVSVALSVEVNFQMF